MQLAGTVSIVLDILQEVQALAAVGAHPNIVQYYSAWAEPDMQGDQLYIQMELCGDSLTTATRLREQQPWREPEVMGLLKQVRGHLELRLPPSCKTAL